MPFLYFSYSFIFFYSFIFLNFPSISVDKGKKNEIYAKLEEKSKVTTARNNDSYLPENYERQESKEMVWRIWTFFKLAVINNVFDVGNGGAWTQTMLLLIRLIDKWKLLSIIVSFGSRNVRLKASTLHIKSVVKKWMYIILATKTMK